MHHRLSDSLIRALQQTRGGDPIAATETLQRVLRDGTSAVPSALDPAADPPRRQSAFHTEADGGHRPRQASSAERDRAGKPRLRVGPSGIDLASLPLNLPATRSSSVIPTVPAGARYEWRTGQAVGTTRRYRLYVPASADVRPRGLVVMLHGCTQHPDDFAVGTGLLPQAERAGLAVAWPEQTTQHNANACWNWFRPGDQRRGAGEPAIVAAIALELRREFAIDPDRVFVAGLSAGGAMAHIVAMRYPEIFSAAGIHSGLALGSAHDLPSAFAAMRGDATSGRAPVPVDGPPRLIVFHGTADRTVHPSNAAHVFGRSIGVAEIDERIVGGRRCRQTSIRAADGALLRERWEIDGLGHAWSGGDAAGSYAVPSGPDASDEMLRFFLDGAGGARA